MCLVDRDEPQVDAGEGRSHRAFDPLRGRVHQLVFAAPEPFDATSPLIGLEARVEECCPHPDLGEPIDLVLHEGDEGGDDEGCAAEHPGDELVGERFSGAGRHDPDAVFAGHDGLDDVALSRSVRRKPERIAQFPVDRGHTDVGDRCGELLEGCDALGREGCGTSVPLTPKLGEQIGALIDFICGNQ